MLLLMVHHKVRDFAAWKSAFDASSDLRRDYGLGGGWIHVRESDPNDLVVVLECEDLQLAKEFMDSPELKVTMERAGVIGTPEITFMKKVCDVPAPQEIPTFAGTA